MTEKTCTKCGEMKAINAFAFQSRKGKDGTYHRYGVCKKCRIAQVMEWRKRNPKKVTAAQRKYIENNREEVNRRSRDWCKENRFRHALTSSRATAKKRNHAPCIATAKELSAAFTGKCMVCGIPEIECAKRLSIDHSHSTGKFRGFLCRRCNKALGLLQDSPEIISSLLEYIIEKEQIWLRE